MITQLQELLRSAGLARISDEIEQIALSSIRLKTHEIDEAQLRLGITKFGGSPDFPQDWKWPERNGFALPFVGQINLSEIASYIPEQLLPSSGMLYFFFDMDAFFESWPRDWTTWAVFYNGNVSSTFQRAAIPGKSGTKKIYRPSAVTPIAEVTLPDYSQYDATSLKRLGLLEPLTDEEEQAYYKVQAQLAQRANVQWHIPIHRLLGYADPVQWDMQKDLLGEGVDWQLLLQVDSDAVPNTDWGDTGRIYYWICKHDLHMCKFNQMQLILQST